VKACVRVSRSLRGIGMAMINIKAMLASLML